MASNTLTSVPVKVHRQIRHFKAVAMASICAVVRLDSDPMPPRLLDMADWIWADVLVLLLLDASAPWHPLQLLV